MPHEPNMRSVVHIPNESRRDVESAGKEDPWHQPLSAGQRRYQDSGHSNQDGMALRIESRGVRASIECGGRAHQAEHVLFHPTRGSVISVTNVSLQEIDLATGALVDEIEYDLFPIVAAAPTSADKAHALDHLIAVGSYFVVGVYQSRYFVVWDLQEMVLQSISEVEKQLQKGMSAITGSLCRDHWLFYASDGSNSVKVTSVDSKEIPKKISRKASNRSSQLVSLAYSTSKRLLCCGSSDGSLQLWLFSEDNTLGGKDEAAMASLLFTTPAIQSPLVQLCFAANGMNSTYLIAGYQSRLVEVWALLSDSASKPRDPQRVASTQLSSEQTVDFAKRSGSLSFCLHPQLPLLITHWHSFHSNSSIVAWVFQPSIGGGSGAGAAGATSEWLDLIPGSLKGRDDACTTGVCWYRRELVAYKSTHTRSLSVLSISGDDSSATSTARAPMTLPSLSSSIQLNLEQYWHYQSIPPNLVQITTNPDGSSDSSIGSSEYILQHFALQSGASEKLDDLPIWKNYQGKSLVPWKVIANYNQSVVCVHLKDPVKTQCAQFSSSGNDDHSFSYVVMEIKPKVGGTSSRRVDADTGEVGGSTSNFRVVCGSQLDALDVCFAGFHQPDNEPQSQRPWLLVVLASTGKSLCLQSKCDQVDENARIVLRREIKRIFPTPIPLTPQSAFASSIGVRLLYLSMDSNSNQLVQLSEDDLNVPNPASPSYTWKASADEAVRDVIWNAPPSVAGEEEMLAAVHTTTRVVILDKNLRQIQEYSVGADLDQPQTLLWMAQTLLFVTKGYQLRYVTPLRASIDAIKEKSHPVCCLGEGNPSIVQQIKLLAVFGDRLSYAVTDLRSLETKAYLRPISICEPLVAGFCVPSERLKAILERDVLVFAMSGGAESPCPITDGLLQVLYHEFGWKETTLRLLDALMNQAGGSSSSVASASASGGSGATSTYPRTAHLSTSLIASLFLHSHKWKDFLKVFLMSDPGLEEYVLAGEGASSAKLPSRTSQLAQRFRRLGLILDSLGQSELALKCFDLAGDDLSIVEMAKKAGTPASPLLTTLQKDWTKMNPPLSAIVQAGDGSTGAVHLESVIWRRHDLFSLLCCDVLLQNERRSRLLTSVKPFDKMTLPAKKDEQRGDVQGCLDKVTPSVRAKILQWKRLVPEDANDWIGGSSTPHFSSEDPKNPNYGFASSSSNASSVACAAGNADSVVGDGIASAGGGSAFTSDAASGKMMIGPFVDEEDAVVAYWRFEEGANVSAAATAAEDSDANAASSSSAGVESMDTSKRENNLQLIGFSAKTIKLVTSSAPVDKGEQGRIQEEFALQFPPSDDKDTTSSEEEWGAKCIVRSGSTLDIGFVFDDDPYRRKITVEMWLRNFVLAKKQQQLQEDDDGTFESSATSLQFADSGNRMIVCRRRQGDDGAADDALWWSFSLVGGHLVLEFADQSIKSDDKVANSASWHHVAFSIDILSPKQATVKLFLQGQCVGMKDIYNVDSNLKHLADGAPSHLHLGWKLTDYEMTEVRIWAAARTQDQISDMKENYLGIAEAKKRMKIAIHQRNCQCEKCHSRRTKGPTAKLSLGTPFPTTPPSTTVRDRRRPQPKQ